MSHTVLTFAGHMAARQTSDARALIETRWCDGRGVHLISIMSMCSIGGISGWDRGLTLVTSGGARSVRSPSRFDHGFIGRAFIGRSRSFAISAIEEHRVDTSWWFDLHRTGDASGWRGAILSKWWRSDDSNWSWTTIVAHDRGSIVVRSLCDHGPIAPRSWLIQPRRCQVKGAMTLPSEGPRSPCDRGHQTHPTTASNGPNFRAQILFKTNVFSPFFFNFWSIREELKWISRKVLSSRDPLLPRA